MKITSILSRLRPVSVFPSSSLSVGERFIGATRTALDIRPAVDIHQEGASALWRACVAAPAGSRTVEQHLADQEFFRSLDSGVNSYCAQAGIATFGGIPATDAQAATAGLRIARHLRDMGDPELQSVATAISCGVAHAQDLAFPGSVRFAVFDVRTDFKTRQLLPEAVANNERILAGGLCIGFEVSDRTLAGRLDGNIDLQHTGASTRGVVPLCPGADATWSATRWAVGLVGMGWRLPGGTTLCIFRADLDALAAAAILTGGFTPEELALPEISARIEAIDRSDNFRTVGEWKPLPPFTPGAPWGGVGDSSVSEIGTLSAVNAVAQDHRLPIERRVQIVSFWLRYGEVFVGGPTELSASRKKVEADRISMLSSIRPTVDGDLAMASSPHMGVSSVLYRLAPNALYWNPVFRGFPVPWSQPGMKYTISTYGGASWVKTRFPALVAALNAADPAVDPSNTAMLWGGNAASGILGSPQGGPSGLTPEQVLEIVKRIRG